MLVLVAFIGIAARCTCRIPAVTVSAADQFGRALVLRCRGGVAQRQQRSEIAFGRLMIDKLVISF